MKMEHLSETQLNSSSFWQWKYKVNTARWIVIANGNIAFIKIILEIIFMILMIFSRPNSHIFSSLGLTSLELMRLVEHLPNPKSTQ